MTENKKKNEHPRKNFNFKENRDESLNHTTIARRSSLNGMRSFSMKNSTMEVFNH